MMLKILIRIFGVITSLRNGDWVDQLLDELVHVLPIGDVEFYGTGLVVPVFADEVIESVLSATHCNGFRSFLDETVGHCGTDARCSTNDESVLVLERHCQEYVLFSG